MLCLAVPCCAVLCCAVLCLSTAPLCMPGLHLAAPPSVQPASPFCPPLHLDPLPCRRQSTSASGPQRSRRAEPWTSPRSSCWARGRRWAATALCVLRRGC